MQLTKTKTAIIITLLLASIILLEIPSAKANIIFTAPDDLGLPNITTSNNSNYLLMANSSHGIYQAYFKNNSKTSNGMMFQSGGYNFSMDISTSQLHWYNSTYNAIIGMTQEMNPQNTALTVSGNTLTYSGAWINTDLQYYADIRQVKETLIIHAISPPSSSIKPDYLQYVSNCYYNNNLTIYANGIGYLHPTNQKFTTNGEINFNDPANKTIFHLPIPVITDSSSTNPQMRNRTLGTYAVTANNGVLIINIRVPKTFIDNAVFPILFDPTIFSDGFESGDFTAWTGTSGTPTITHIPVHHDLHSAYFNADPEYIYKDFAGEDNTFARFYVYFDTLVGGAGVVVWLSVLTAETNLGQHSAIVEVRDGHWCLETYEAGVSSVSASAIDPIADVWYCVELRRDVTSGVCKVFVDGNEVCTEDRGLTGNTIRFLLGVGAAGGGPTLDFYGDCVVVADTYIGPESAGDTTPPTYSALSSSSMVAGASCQLNSTWTDETGLATTGNTTLLSCTINDNVAVDKVIYSWNNTGVWVNQTALSGSGISYIANFTGTWNSTVGNVVSVRIFANDSSNNWGTSSITNFTLTVDSGRGQLPPDKANIRITVIDWLNNPIYNATVTVRDYYQPLPIGTNQTDHNGTTIIEAPYTVLLIQAKTGVLTTQQTIAHTEKLYTQNVTLQFSAQDTITNVLTTPILRIPLYILIIIIVIALALIYVLFIQKVKT